MSFRSRVFELLQCEELMQISHSATPPYLHGTIIAAGKEHAPDHRYSFSSAAANGEDPRQPSSIEESRRQVKDQCTS